MRYSLSISICGQKKAAISIYRFHSLEIIMHDTASLKHKLHVDNFKFELANAFSIKQQIPPLNFRKMGLSAAEYVYDSYEKYENSNLIDQFSLNNDPTRWNLPCLENRMQPYFLQQQKVNN